MHKCAIDYNIKQDIKVEHGEIEYVNNLFKRTLKIHFYNPLINEPLIKFVYFIKNAKVVKTDNNKITIVLNSNDINLISSIKKLDDITNQILNEKHFNSAYSIIEQPLYPPKMEIYIDTVSSIYDIDNKKISRIEHHKTVMLYVEFDYVIINDISVKRWRLLQMKETESIINLSANMFDEPPKQNIPQPPQPPPPPPPPPPQFIQPNAQHIAYIPPKINIKPVNNTEQPKQLMFDFNELLKKKNNLKPSIRVKDNICVEEKFTDKLVLQRLKLKKNVVNDKHIISDIIRFLDEQIQLNSECDILDTEIADMLSQE